MQHNSLSLTPPKLRWLHPLSPFLPPTKSLTPPHHRTHLLLPPSHQSAGLVACSCIVLCWESARADGGVLDWPADSRFSRRPRVQGDVDEQFFSFCPLFKMSFFVFCQLWSGGGDQRAGGEAERAPQAWSNSPLKSGSKVGGLTVVADGDIIHSTGQNRG